MTTAITLLHTWLHGEFVGEDELGNRYYREKRASDPSGRRRRWVVYKGEAEGSKIPPLWNAWIHYGLDEPPLDGAAKRRPWQKPHVPNLTGTRLAYRPPGDMDGGEHPEGMPPAYRPWRP